LYVPRQFAAAGGVDIYDVHAGRLRDRVLLPEHLVDTSSINIDVLGQQAHVLTVDEDGARLFVLTESGVAVVELGVVPLSIGSVPPDSGPAAGGTSITVRGSGFVDGTAASVRGVAAATTFVDASTLRFTAPAMSAGAARLTLTNPDGSRYSLDAAFRAE